MYYIGIDVSKQVLNVFDGERDLTFENEKGLEGFESYLRKHYPSGFEEIGIIFEPAGPYSSYLKEFCAVNKIKVYIINPKKSANFTRAIGNRSKTDKIDARMLYAFSILIREEELRVPEIDETVLTLSQYISTYQLILKGRVSLSNHIEALKRKEVREEEILSTLEKEVEHRRSIEEKLIAEAEGYILKDSKLRNGYRNLLSIPGVGRVASINLIYVFKKYSDANRQEITALTGLDPTRKESGSSVNGRKKISKSGSSNLRKVLYLASMNAIRNNFRIKSVYERLIENHKPKKVALIGAMRKLLLISHAVYRSGKPFYFSDLKENYAKTAS